MNPESIEKLNRIILPAIGETFYMVGITTFFSVIFGFILATILYATDEKGLRPSPVLNNITSFIVNIIRSFPFVILVVALIPFTRSIVGTVIGNTAALVPLIITGTALMTRLYESSFREIDYELVEAVKSFGATDFQILKNVIFVEAVPSLISGLTVAIVSILSYTAAAGAVGAGGLGSVAMTYGYSSFDDTIMYGTVVVLVIIVQIIQMIGNSLYKRSQR